MTLPAHPKMAILLFRVCPAQKDIPNLLSPRRRLRLERGRSIRTTSSLHASKGADLQVRERWRRPHLQCPRASAERLDAYREVEGVAPPSRGCV